MWAVASRMPYLFGFTVMTYATLSAGLVFAQGVTGVGNLITNDPLSVYLDKGGLAIMVGVLLYFYRNVMATTKEQSELVVKMSREYSEVLVRIVGDSTKASTESAIALNASTRAVADSVVAINANTIATQNLSKQLTTRGAS